MFNTRRRVIEALEPLNPWMVNTKRYSLPYVVGRIVQEHVKTTHRYQQGLIQDIVDLQRENRVLRYKLANPSAEIEGGK